MSEVPSHRPDQESPEPANSSALAENRRTSPRYPLDAVLEIQPIDEHGLPCGERKIGKCLNVSDGGIAFVLCETSVKARYLYLNPLSPGTGLSNRQIEVLRIVPRGAEYEIAGRFVTLPDAPNP